MANRRTIDDINARLDVLHRRLTRTVSEINDLRSLRKRIRLGRVKQPPPTAPTIKLPIHRADDADNAAIEF